MVFAAALAVAAGAVAAVLVRQLRSRPDVPIRFAAIALGAAAVHALLFAVVFRRWAIRGAAIYVAASALLFAAAGGARHAAGLVVLVASALLLGAAGRRIGALFLPDHSLTTGVSLGVGIAAASLVVSLALLFGVFGTPFLAGFALAAVALAVPELRRRKAGTSALVSDIGAGAQLTGAVVIELTFLFGAAAIVRGIAPESGFDALTRYLPWLKIAARTGAFPDIPWQFPFIIPQSGVAFSLLYTFDPVAQRVAMLLALAVCAAIAGARRLRKDVAPGLAGLVALVVASCPLVLVAAHGVQPDAFSWLAVLLLGVAAGDGDPHRAAFWPACGALAALAWCGKYSTAGFAVPFLLYALGRAAEAESWSKALAKATIGAGAGASIAGGPWLLHAWRESRNPFFPLATSLFPSPLWKVRLDSIWQQGFAFGKGLRSWLLLPIDMTIHTNRFAENKPGTFGLTFLAILFFSAVALRAASRTERVWLASAVAGTLLVWTQNPLVRYWMPALWLAVPAAARGAEATARRVGRRAVIGGLAGIVVLQVAIDAFPTKGDLEGRRWAVYTGRTSEAEFIGRMPGADALAGLARIDPTFPKVWYSGIFAVGHADVVPLVGERWELALHAPVGNRQALFRWIDSVGCRYWAVANALPDRAEFERIGVAERYWHDSDIVIRDATTTIYRMPAGDILTK